MSSEAAPWRLSLPGGLDAPARARHAVAGGLNGELNTERNDDLKLLLHELVANCVLHAGADGSQMIDLEMTIDDEAVRVAVSDHGSAGVPTVRESGDARPGGYGLRLVEALSDAWGMRREGSRRTTLWFELRRHAPEAT
jgi:anti-sigma regulatory factor (Ser/Thr protein kinase)